MSEAKKIWAEKIIAMLDEWPHRGSDNIAHDIIALVEDAEITRLTARVRELEGALEGVLPLAESYLNIMPDRHGIHTPKIEAARAALTKGKSNDH